MVDEDEKDWRKINYLLKKEKKVYEKKSKKEKLTCIRKWKNKKWKDTIST